MSAISHLVSLARLAGDNAPKVVYGLVRMHWRYFLFGRGRGLDKLLPLDTPLKVHVDPASGCNFKCFFCPQSEPEALAAAGVKAGVMKLPLFKKLVDDLKELPGKVDELVLGNYGEPLLNKNLPEMIRYAVDSNCAREVSIITNASLLTPDRAEAIAAAGLHKIRISIEALSDQAYEATVDVPVRFGDIVENVRNFQDAVRRHGGKTFIYAKIIDIGFSPEDKKKFFDIFAPITDAVSIENLMPVNEKSIQFIGTQPKGMTGVSLSKGRAVCPSPFYSLSVHMDGDVGVCCADWHHKTSVGSIADRSLKDIWNGPELAEFRLQQLTRSWRNIAACQGCEIVHHYPVYEDLDAHREKLRQTYDSGQHRTNSPG